MSIVIKKEESPIIVPLLVSEDKKNKPKEHSSLPSLPYPTSSPSPSRASSRLTLYHTCLPPHRFSPHRRGNSLDLTYHPATIIRSPTPLHNPLTGGQSTIMELPPTPPLSPPPLAQGRVLILSITLYAEYSYHWKSRILLERDYSLVLSRAKKHSTLNGSGRASTQLEPESKKNSIVKRDFHPTILVFLILYYVVGLEATLLPLLYVTTSLLFSLDSHLGYLGASAKITFTTSRIVHALRRVPRFEAPLHVPRLHNPSPRPPPPYVRGPHVILEDETDKPLSS